MVIHMQAECEGLNIEPRAMVIDLIELIYCMRAADQPTGVRAEPLIKRMLLRRRPCGTRREQLHRVCNEMQCPWRR